MCRDLAGHASPTSIIDGCAPTRYAPLGCERLSADRTWIAVYDSKGHDFMFIQRQLNTAHTAGSTCLLSGGPWIFDFLTDVQQSLC